MSGSELDGIWIALYSDLYDDEDEDAKMLRAAFTGQNQRPPRLSLLHVTAWVFDTNYLQGQEEEVPEWMLEHQRGPVVELRRFLAAFWTLVQQKLAVRTLHRADRATRRRMERERVELPTEVQVVTLRRQYSKAEPDDGEHETVEWSHRWMVDGHWRNQWVPSLNMHRLTFIAPHVKGPADKPLIVRDKVYRWTR